MKHFFQYTLLLSLSLLGLFNLASCGDENLCAIETCNTGTLDEESCTCDCPDGFSGSSCEVEDLCVTQNVSCENGGTCVDGTCDCPDGFLGDNCEEFDLSDIQALLDGGITPKALFDAGVTLDELYGKYYAEGILFFLDISSGLAIVSALEDYNYVAEWGCSTVDVSGINNVTTDPQEPEVIQGARIGDGLSNTTAIINRCNTDLGGFTAAELCSTLGDDWFLPSRATLNLMYQNLHAKGLGGFEQLNYWTSTEYGTFDAWYQSFETGEQDFDGKQKFNWYRPAKSVE